MNSFIKRQNETLEKFLKSAQYVKGEELVNLIKEALIDSDLFFYSELLYLPNVQELKEESNFKGFYEFFESFCYDDLKSYKEKEQEKGFPKLSEKELEKLKQLTFIGLAMGKKRLFYTNLVDLLEFESVRDLEDFFIAIVYQGIIKGKINQKEKYFSIKSTIPREASPSKIPEFAQSLKTWLKRCDKVVEEINKQHLELKDHFKRKYKEDEDRLEEFRATRLRVIEKVQNSGSSGKGKNHHNKGQKRSSRD